jgi:hypothetical protein
MSRLRRREILPEDTGVHAVLSEPKLVYGQYGRQVEVRVRVAEGEYKNAEFKDWFSFGKDEESGEEFIRYGSPLYDALVMVADNIEDVLDDDDLSDKEYEKFVKGAVAKLDGVEIMGRVGIKVAKNNADKKRNFLQPGCFGPYQDPNEVGDDLDMGEGAS